MNNKKTWFGGFNVMFVGDFAQLPPVLGKVIYQPYGAAESDIEKIGKRAFESIRTTFRLQDNHRQTQDKEFKELLERARYGVA